ncbi:MAG TPA: hypothetical protein VGN57_10005 [Pirellulaceae bacterium]|jgi:YHS domain-containing protein|nr:hypothetical protein [Pirellulaceae bacterium]
MTRKLTLFTFAAGAVALASVALYVGCDAGPAVAPAEPEAPTTDTAAEVGAPVPAVVESSDVAVEEEHGHIPGAHGGIIVPIGRDSYHAEAVFEQGGVLRLFMLGADESRVQEVESQSLTAYVKPMDGGDSVPVAVEPMPQEGDSEGKTSQFVGQLPEDLSGTAVEVTIPSLRIDGERFRIGFESAIAHADEAMPEKVADDEERQLYLTPGGLYTQDDIEANGNVTASQKFKGLRASHDLKPQPGDPLCPITLTKANPQFTWVVAGKEYQFCCPPCVDEFVTLAKAGGPIGEPEDFLQE